MELVCPSCEARYRVPDVSIGADGRQVSCSNCGERWHAPPPLALAGTAEDSGRTQWQPGWRVGGAHGHEAGEGAGDAISRREQLAQIRDMLAEVQSENRDPVASDAAAGRSYHAADDVDRNAENDAAPPVAPAATLEYPRRTEVETATPVVEDEPARRRVAIDDRDDSRRADITLLRQRHAEEARLRKHRRSGGVGAFMTGFLLVVIVAAAMIALYMLHPQIIARFPETEPVLTEYVATVDEMRVEVARAYEAGRDWVAAQIGEGA